MIVRKILGTILAALVLSGLATPVVAQADNDGGSVGPAAIWELSFDWEPDDSCASERKLYVFKLKAKRSITMRPESKLYALLNRDDIVFPKMAKAHRQGKNLIWQVRVPRNTTVLNADVRVSGSGVPPTQSVRVICLTIQAPDPMP